jgi:hypothetical protein
MRDLMDRTPVERFEFRGEPVSRLTIRPTLMPDRMPGRRVQALTLLIGKDDLIRKRTMWFQGGRAVSVTYSYDQMHIPFPEEVFVFTPPDGVVEAAGKKDSRIIP